MTLAKQTIIICVIALVLIFISTFVISVHNSRSYFSDQLHVNAVDTSTSLGITISSKLGADIDKTMILSIINAAFDRGHFKLIRMRDNSEAIIASRYVDDMNIKVPKWFIDLVPIQTTTESALIMHGWHQLGLIEVEPDPTIAYAALWATTKELFGLFLLITILVIVITVALIKITFRPLNAVTKQAEDIAQKNMYVLPNVSSLQELKSLSETMNSMVVKLKEYFAAQIKEVEDLKLEVYQDHVTGFGNRRYFFSLFNQYLQDEKVFVPGHLCLIKIFGLVEYNQEHGYHSGDKLLCSVANKLDSVFAHEHRLILARMDNPSFCVLVTEQSFTKVRQIVDELFTACNLLIANSASQDLKIGITLVNCSFQDNPSNILSKADSNIQMANSVESCSLFINESELKVDTSAEQWLEVVNNAIAKRQFHFYMQPILGPEKLHHNELFIKLFKDDDSEVAAKNFFPIIDQYSLGGKIDRLVIEEVAKQDYSGIITINLSKMTVLEPEQQDLFIKTLQQQKFTQDLELLFEFSEGVLEEHIPAAKCLVTKLQQLGYKVGLDRVGLILAPLAYLTEINLSYLKLDASFTRHIDSNSEHQGLIQKWLALVATLDLELIATAVETEKQWSMLRSIGVNYFQGNYIQKPQRAFV